VPTSCSGSQTSIAGRHPRAIAVHPRGTRRPPNPLRRRWNRRRRSCASNCLDRLPDGSGCGCGDRPAPVWGARSSASCCRLDGSGSCSTLRGLRLASVVLYPARRFRYRFALAGLALRRHGRVKIEECRTPPAHAARALWLACPGPGRWPPRRPPWRVRWRSHPGRDRLRRRRDVGIRLVSRCRFCVRREIKPTAPPPCHWRASLLLPAGDTQGIPSENDRRARSGRLPKRFHPALAASAGAWPAVSNPRLIAGILRMEPTGIEPVTSCLQSRGGPAGANRYGGSASVKVALLLAKMVSAVLKAVLATRWYSGGTLRDRWLLTASKAAVIQPARS